MCCAQSVRDRGLAGRIGWGFLPTLGTSNQVMVLPRECGGTRSKSNASGSMQTIGALHALGLRGDLDGGKATFESRQYSEYSRLTIRKPKSWN